MALKTARLSLALQHPTLKINSQLTLGSTKKTRMPLKINSQLTKKAPKINSSAVDDLPVRSEAAQRQAHLLVASLSDFCLLHHEPSSGFFEEASGPTAGPRTA